MGGKLYVGVGGTATKVKKLYVGVNGVARKVKKLYVGVNGIARKVFGGGDVSYYGNSTEGTLNSLSSKKWELAAATIGNYAVFAGGRSGTGNNYGSKSVEAYNQQLTKTTATDLGRARYDLAGASNDYYAVFATGMADNSTKVGTVDAYDASLTLSSPSSISSLYMVSALRLGNNLVFCGGRGSDYTKTAKVFDNSLTVTTISNFLTTACGQVGVATVGDYGIFAGGYTGSYIDTTNVYDLSLTKITGTAKVNSKLGFKGARTNTHAIFGTGTTDSGYGTLGTAYDSSLTKHDIEFSVCRSILMATASFEDCCIFAGGSNPNKSVVDGFDTSLTLRTHDSLTVGVSDNACAVLGDYALFAGGYTSTIYQLTDIVEVYSVS